MGLTVKLFCLLAFTLIPVVGRAQSESLKLIEKYENAQMFGWHFFNNDVTERLVVYESVDKILKERKLEIVRLEIISYKKGFKQGREFYTFTKDSLIAYNYRSSISTLPGRVYHFVKFLPSNVYDIFHKTHRVDSLVTIKDVSGRIISSSTNNWTEQYSYDANENLTLISKTFNAYGRDSTLTKICVSIAKSWKGVYVNDKLESELTYWDNEGVVKSFHRRENGYLVETLTDSFLTDESQIAKYYYTEGLIQKKEVFTKSGKLLKRKVYKWKI